MSKHNYFVTFLKKINLSINSLIKKYLNKLNFNNFSNIAISNKFFLIFVALIILFLSYLSIPNTYDKTEINKELKNQLKDRFNLNFNLSQNLEYNFFPRPHFVSKNSTIVEDQNEISKIKILKIYVSLTNLFSLKNINVNDLILKDSNFILNSHSSDFFIKLLSQNFKKSNLIIRDSNIFYKNKDNEVLFINKIKKMKYYYDTKDLKNFVVSNNEIFNFPYSVELFDNTIEKKIFSKININFLKLKIENVLDYNGNYKKGSANYILKQKKSTINYELKKDKFIFNIFDKLDDSNFSYKGEFNFNPFYSNFEGETKKIDLFHLLNSNGLILQLLKTEILNNKNLNLKLNVYTDKIKNYQNFIKFFLNAKIREGLIDIDNTNIAWKNDVDFTITDSLIYVKEGELILDGKLNINIKNSNGIYKFLLTPKNYRTELEKIELNFIYNFDQKITNLNNIRIDNEVNKNINQNLKNLIFKNDKLQNKVYLKKILNKVIKSYAG